LRLVGASISLARLENGRVRLGAVGGLSILPFDVLRHLALRFLAERDVLRLADALVGRRFEWTDVGFALDVPPWLVDVWVHALATERMLDMINQLADDGLWLASAFDRVSVHVDWSPFSPRPYRPVAVYSWHTLRPHLRLKLDRVEVEHCVRRAACRGCSSLTASIYIGPFERVPATLVSSTSFAVLPPHLLSSPSIDPVVTCSNWAGADDLRKRPFPHGRRRLLRPPVAGAPGAWRPSAHAIQFSGL